MAVRAAFSAEIGADGSAWRIEPAEIELPPATSPGPADEDWSRLRDAAVETWKDPRTHLLRCLATPSYPPPLEPLWSRDGRREWSVPATLGPCLTAALRGGLLASETAETREMARAIGDALMRDPEAPVDGMLQIRSSLMLLGTRSDERGRELALVSGEVVVEAAVPRSQAARIGIEVLIDPYLGMPVRQDIDASGTEAQPGPGDPAWAGMLRTASFITHLPAGFPRREEAKAAIQSKETSPRPTIAEIYRASIGGVFTVVSSAGSGTGFAIAPDVVVTAGHLVESAEEVWVISHSGAAVPAEVIPQPDPEIDVAFLRVAPETPLQALELADDLPEIGTPVLAIGTALGMLEGTLTAGVVGNVKAVDDHHVLIFDAAVNPGNSGGPLIGPEGEVVGMVVVRSAVEKGIVGLNFALFSADIRGAYRALDAGRPET